MHVPLAGVLKRSNQDHLWRFCTTHMAMHFPNTPGSEVGRCTSGHTNKPWDGFLVGRCRIIQQTLGKHGQEGLIGSQAAENRMDNATCDLHPLNKL